MEKIKNLINYKKIIVNILFLLLFASIIINFPEFPLFYDGFVRLTAYIIISGFAVFYIHGLVLFPILEQESNKRRYKNFVFSTILIYTLFLVIFWISNRENLENAVFNSKHDSILLTLSKYFTLIIAPISITILLSYGYSAIFLGKKVLFQFLEFFVNFIVTALLYFISLVADDGTSILLLNIILFVFYINVFYSIPIFVKKKQTKKYWLITLMVSVGYFFTMLGVLFSHISATLGYKDVLTIIFNLFGVLCLIYILSSIYGYIRLKIKRQKKVLDLKLDAKNSELKLLKSQVNPHFLFNTLNTLYAVALEENALKTAESTAKLANLIRYMQKDINKDFIPLKNEIKYLKDYITIQKLRCAIEPQIDTEFINIENHYISPGLLIPFVENAFKYGIDSSKSSSLKVSVICNEKTINFECINSFNTDFKIYYKEQGFGIGIKNAKQRLELVYPKKHTFDVVEEKEAFSVNIRINLK